MGRSREGALDVQELGFDQIICSNIPIKPYNAIYLKPGRANKRGRKVLVIHKHTVRHGFHAHLHALILLASCFMYPLDVPPATLGMLAMYHTLGYPLLFPLFPHPPPPPQEILMSRIFMWA